LNEGGKAVFQAVKAFEIFTGIALDADRMQANVAAMMAGDKA
jgi:shikimate 5-dehydrogenase